jgi:hypothetical protein
MRRLRLLGSLVLCLLGAHAPGMELWQAEDGDHYLTLSPVLKLSALGARYPDDGVLFPRQWSGTGLFRQRLDLHLRWSDAADARLAYELSGRWASRGGGGDSLGLLPDTAAVPFRLTPVLDTWSEGERFLGVHELDRAFVSFHPSWGEVTVGRQAIGLGRGVLFSAVDLFAPFSPLEVDREWRRGVDAIRLERTLSPTSSAELIAVAGESWDESAVLARLRGYVGPLDAEILGGKRGTDGFVGTSLSATVGEAEMHAELAVFRARHEHPQGSIFGDGRTIPKAVFGSSYTFAVGNGLTLVGEYHYSGFGSREPEEIQTLLGDPEYLARYLRGDTQILCRHALGVQASYPVNMFLGTTLNVLVSPEDGSGVLSPSLRWDISRTVSIIVVGNVGWGREPENGVLRSAYGASGQSLYVQLGLYF